MRRRISLSLAILLLLGGCGAEEPLPSAPPAPTATAAVETPAQPIPSAEEGGGTAAEVPVLRYETRDWYILHTELDRPDLSLVAYHEIPVFQEESEGYRRINAFFEEKTRAFFGPENKGLAGLVEDGEIRAGLRDEVEAYVTFQGKNLVSVILEEYWLGGGVSNFISESHTFRIDTGERLTLEQLVEETPEEARERILAAVGEWEHFYDRESSLEVAEAYALEDFQFALHPEGVEIRFNSYELARPSAAGSFSVWPELTVRDCWLEPLEGEKGRPELDWEELPSSYPTKTTYIHHRALEPQGLRLNCYFEIPVLEETGEGGRRINAFFEGLETDFFSGKNEDLTFIWESSAEGDPYDSTYQYYRDATVTFEDEGLVSTAIHYYWFAGGVQDYGSDRYTFLRDTGEVLTLTDLVEEDQEEIMEAVIAAFSPEDPGYEDINFEGLRARPVEELKFGLYPDGLWVFFDKYEIAHGAAGAFSVKPALTRRELS